MMQMAHTILVLSILGSYVVSLTATISPDYALQDVDYLCNGSLQSNTTVVLDGGEHRISTNCTISNISNVTIIGSSMMNSTAIRCEEGSGLRFVSVQQLTIERVTFVSCGIILTNTENTLFTTCMFQNNSGSAVTLNGSTGNVSIINCTFQNNSATNGGGGAVMLSKLTAYVSIINCTFQNNSATNVTYGGGAISWLSLSITSAVSITNCHFEDNNAALMYTIPGNDIERIFGGGAVLLYGRSEVISITDCTFQNNSATLSCGALWLYGSTSSIKYCKFQNNSAIEDGGAVDISSDTNSEVVIDTSTFINNSAVRGAAVYASNNQCFCNGYQNIRGGAIYFNGMSVTIMGDTITGSQFLSNSPLGAIQGENGFLQLNGNISFTNNIGKNGGAISLSSVPLYFNQSTVEFSRNVATGFGGAIYNDGGPMPIKTDLSRCSILFSDPSLSVSNYITFTGNHAQLGGHSIYATPMYGCWCIEDFRYNCGIEKLDTYYTRITPLPEDLNAPQVLSFPTYVQLCNCSDPALCNVTRQDQGKVTTYPGGTVRLNVTTVDVGNNLSPSVVYASTGTITLGPGQEAQWVRKACGALSTKFMGQKCLLQT